MTRRALVMLLLLLLPGPLLAADGHASMLAHTPRMSFLDNGVVKVGADLAVGGAITYLSVSGKDQNLINSFDFGRQVQMSYYSGPIPFKPQGATLSPAWAGLGWNPIQVGDAFGHWSKVIESTNDSHTLYVRCVPMQWPLDNVPGDCTFEWWLTLDGPAVHVRSRLSNQRLDHAQYSGRGQEIPAIYTNGPWYRLMTYSGERPLTGDTLTQIQKKIGDPAPWSGFAATEHWAALLNDQDFGLGVFTPDILHYTGGFAGQPGAGGPSDDPTGYIAPNPTDILDWNITYDRSFDLIVGTLQTIRQYAVAHAPPPALPADTFDHDRRGWSYVNATDSGWPIHGQLDIQLDQNDPQLHGPITFFHADEARTLVIDAALDSKRADGQFFWHGLNSDFDDQHTIPFPLINDGAFHTFRLDLSHSPQWHGVITQLRFDPIGAGAPGDHIRIRSIRMEK